MAWLSIHRRLAVCCTHRGDDWRGSSALLSSLRFFQEFSTRESGVMNLMLNAMKKSSIMMNWSLIVMNAASNVMKVVIAFDEFGIERDELAAECDEFIIDCDEVSHRV
jgi:hypothetical protein